MCSAYQFQVIDMNKLKQKALININLKLLIWTITAHHILQLKLCTLFNMKCRGRVWTIHVNLSITLIMEYYMDSNKLKTTPIHLIFPYIVINLKTNKWQTSKTFKDATVTSSRCTDLEASHQVDNRQLHCLCKSIHIGNRKVITDSLQLVEWAYFVCNFSPKQPTSSSRTDGPGVNFLGIRPDKI